MYVCMYVCMYVRPIYLLSPREAHACKHHICHKDLVGGLFFIFIFYYYFLYGAQDAKAPNPQTLSRRLLRKPRLRAGFGASSEAVAFALCLLLIHHTRYMLFFISLSTVSSGA
ncbi:hypothetical protein M441DRAFT_258427 [Trichoderma asperellum CBS 433.97]|uniref:Uncharacterized protein n=1 Tax=Trichoderma asperellum (strain ATCC 204424 / CBS 433.97 / NBRC 101777) TaxID=1042311 RepID=A0A2T3YZ16_TRIA4|nr:hypothetical protein M441DRAFT_258427 [Trichoderma asperellum CBS 433.97]PTB37821.1 hypothetical protein M441DRAFT_258427 [Trichoderma asperellum CBS 433.97]